MICYGISDRQTGCRRRRMEHRWNLRLLCTGRSRLALLMAALPVGPKCCLPLLSLTQAHYGPTYRIFLYFPEALLSRSV